MSARAADEERDPEDERLVALESRFLDALKALEAGEVDSGSEILRGVLKVEPRLAEPRLELARVLLNTGQTEEAEEQAREALRILEAGGQWLDDPPDNVVLSLAADLLGEILRQRADTDEVVFGDAEVWRALVDESMALFKRAHALDPDNEHAADMVLGRLGTDAANEQDDADEASSNDEDSVDQDPE